VLVICELLGVPYADRERFRGWSDDIGHLRDRARAEAALQQLRSYMANLIKQKRFAPGQDVISDLLAARDERGQLSESEIVRYAAGLLFAGHETTVARIDFGTLLLLAHPDQRERLVRNPALVQSATEEVLRLAAPSDTELPRYAQEDIQLEGVTIRAGDAVLLAIAAANRDPRVFRDPDRFDVTRDPNPHLAFGYGGRYCLGASLARLELRAVFGSLFRRLPGLRLAVPIEQLQLRRHLLTGGLEALPVAS
jgi:pentalenolactone synthase